jgi:ribosome biogenesis protein Nip4
MENEKHIAKNVVEVLYVNTEKKNQYAKNAEEVLYVYMENIKNIVKNVVVLHIANMKK